LPRNSFNLSGLMAMDASVDANCWERLRGF
jgi:hypothetical protein